MTEPQKIDKMFSALRRMVSGPIPDRLCADLCDDRVILPDGRVLNMSDVGYDEMVDTEDL